MKLLTKEIERKLRDNATKQEPVRGTDQEIDFVPVVKFFTPWGAGTWLFTELDSDGDTLFGLCDLGFGSPELGSASLSEIQSVSGPWGLKVERDMHWTGTKPLSEYANDAREQGRIAA